jgi:uncharacterized membrane protein YfcA
MDGTLSIIIIFFSGFIASMISAIVGFGGAILLLPILTYSMDIKLAIPLLTVALIFSNASRVYFGREELKWEPIIKFLIGAIPFVIIGSILFSYLNGNIIKNIVGVFLVAIVILKRIIKTKLEMNNSKIFLGGMITGIISGVAGNSGHLSALLFNSLKLTVGSYIASEAFAALTMHIIKIILYKKYLEISMEIMICGIAIGIVMIFGSYTGKKIVDKIPRKHFQIIIEICLIISGIQMIIVK